MEVTELNQRREARKLRPQAKWTRAIVTNKPARGKIPRELSRSQHISITFFNFVWNKLCHSTGFS
ncbi:hypothetical protein DPMN_175816 [Dreissena polymorpha]|uniref:Uncharacterized protein n=1 Tax=Dreissena polymorpha TaxID=45954 RepID=A0A9D4E8U6_DREPO|nr:hypothetical protein DPMN_175816 [Dreissena polymorpha]